MTATSTDFYADDALPFHYRDNGTPCTWSGHVAEHCPAGCDHADHYANDGHAGCQDETTPRREDR
jgi:hypothetical protein